MKRGSLRPNVATRWTMGGSVGRLYAPPMYVKVSFTAFMVWPVDDPDVVPVEISSADATIGMYSYDTRYGADVWAGSWSNAFGDGDWHFSQQISQEHGTLTCFALYYGGPAGGSFIAEWSHPDDQNGLWNDAFVDRHGASNWLMPSYPWIFLDFASVQAVSYTDLKSLRYPVRPNKPWTFFYSA